MSERSSLIPWFLNITGKHENVNDSNKLTSETLSSSLSEESDMYLLLSEYVSVSDLVRLEFEVERGVDEVRISWTFTFSILGLPTGESCGTFCIVDYHSQRSLIITFDLFQTLLHTLKLKHFIIHINLSRSPFSIEATQKRSSAFNFKYWWRHHRKNEFFVVMLLKGDSWNWRQDDACDGKWKRFLY